MRGAWSKRLLLARMRCPAGHPDDVGSAAEDVALVTYLIHVAVFLGTREVDTGLQWAKVSTVQRVISVLVRIAGEVIGIAGCIQTDPAATG